MRSENKKRSVRHGQIAVYYDLKYLKDSTKTDKYTEAKTLLQISDKYTKYGDYYQLALDSMDIYMGKARKTHVTGKPSKHGMKQ